MDSMNMTDSGSSTNMTSSASSDSMTMTMMMVPYLHFTKGDTVIFKSIVPSSPGAIFGACLIFFLLGILSRWLHAFRRGLERRLVLRSTQLSSRYPSSTIQGEDSSSSKDDRALNPDPSQCCAPPKSRFILSHELSRGATTGCAETLHYLLMLVVMTFNASYIISIIVGTIIGEVAFGRLHRR